MVELLLLVPATSVDLVSDALLELDAAAVTVKDADADTPDEQPIFGEPGMPQTQTEKVAGWQRSVLKALFEDEAAAQAACVTFSGAETALMRPRVAQGIDRSQTVATRPSAMMAANLRGSRSQWPAMKPSTWRLVRLRGRLSSSSSSKNSVMAGFANFWSGAEAGRNERIEDRRRDRVGSPVPAPPPRPVRQVAGPRS